MTVSEGLCKVCPSQAVTVLRMGVKVEVSVHIALHIIYSREGVTFRLVLK